ncbi:MAG: hypothetical protein E6Q95_03765 [Chitinophagaceae bacterium]|nr:MAG: hypothetical protein E6Q95_03765 [Chitinophagaceae bacterium]
MEISKLKSEKELTAKENTLEAHLHYLNLKNQQIQSLENELKLISHSSSSNNKLKTLKLQELLNDHLMTEDSWQNFKTAYINERAEEFNQIIELFPGISDASLRVVLLQKLGLNNTETAQLLGVTTEAIKKSKQRLKKKYNLTNTDI